MTGAPLDVFYWHLVHFGKAAGVKWQGLLKIPSPSGGGLGWGRTPAPFS